MMGREIRRVPPNWKHPMKKDDYGRDQLRPMYDETFEQAVAEWKEGFRKWEAGENEYRQKYKNDDGTIMEYWEWEATTPDRAYYRPWKDEDATWYQMWETVSEGTPVTPPFETQQELADYLAAHGDEWDQKRCLEPDWKSLWGGTPGVSGWGKERAERFVFGNGWSPSMVVVDGKIMSNPGEIAEAFSK
jgi:hypothetical protein